MKKAVMMFVLLAVVVAMAQKPKESVAVYMAGTEPVAVKGAYKVLGAELAKSLAKSGNYTAVDRTPEVIKVLSAADIFNKDGAIDVDKAKRAGKQLGVQMMCVAEITEVMKSYFLEARLVNVETAEISNVATAHGNMTAVDDVMRNAQAIAAELTGGKVKLADFSFREIEANPDKAISEYTKAIQQEPNVAEYYIKRGYAYFIGKRDLDNAIPDFTEAIRLDPNYAEGYSQRGIAYSIRGSVYDIKEDKDRAIADFTQAIRLNPNNVEAYYNRGTAYGKDYDRAISDYTQVIRLDPNYAMAYYGRGNSYNGKNDYDKAISDFTQAIRLIRLNPNLAAAEASAYYTRGISYGGKGDYDQAISDFTEAIRLNPNDADAYSNRGVAYVMKGDYDRAVADWESVLRIDPNNSYAQKRLEEIREEQSGGKAYLNKGNAYFEKGDYDNAISAYTQAIRLNPNYARAYYNRGAAYFLKKDYGKAADDWAATLRIDPNNSDARENLKDIREMMEEAQDGVPSSGGGVSPVQEKNAPPPVQQAKPTPPPPPMSPKDAAKAAFLRGETASKNGNRGEAIEEYSEAIRLDPNGYDYNGIQNYYAKRAFELYLSGYNSNAISDYTEAIRIDKSAGNSRFTEHHYRSRGECYRRIGNYAKAITDYEEYLRLDPKGIYAKSVKKDLNKAKRLIKQSPVQPAVPPPSPIAAILAFERGKAAYENKDYDKAVKEFTEAIRLDPNGNSSYYSYRAMVYNYQKKDYNKAITDYTEVIRIEPDWASIYERRGDCYMEVKNYAQAIADYEEHLRRDPKHKWVKYQLEKAKRLMK